MRFVPMTGIAQQDIQAVHRVRQLLVQQRTALVNQACGLLREYGVFIPAGIRQFRHAMPSVLEDAENELTDLTRQLMADLYRRLLELDQQIADYERHPQGLCFRSAACRNTRRMGVSAREFRIIVMLEHVAFFTAKTFATVGHFSPLVQQ